MFYTPCPVLDKNILPHDGILIKNWVVTYVMFLSIRSLCRLLLKAYCTVTNLAVPRLSGSAKRTTPFNGVYGRPPQWRHNPITLRIESLLEHKMSSAFQFG